MTTRTPATGSAQPLTRHRGPWPIEPGSQVEVRCRFDGRWVHGFAVAEIRGPTGHRRFRLQRHSDGEVLPGTFSVDEIRPADTTLGRSLRE